MFTIKHITPFGNEALHAALEVTYCPVDVPKPYYPDAETAEGKPKMGDLTGMVMYLPANSPQNGMGELYGGIVYVMNDHGSTVGKYELGGHLRNDPK